MSVRIPHNTLFSENQTGSFSVASKQQRKSQLFFLELPHTRLKNKNDLNYSHLCPTNHENKMLSRLFPKNKSLNQAKKLLEK